MNNKAWLAGLALVWLVFNWMSGRPEHLVIANVYVAALFVVNEIRRWL